MPPIMLSRVAESLYWMARQVERAENMARFLEVTQTFDLDQPGTEINPWWPLVQVTADTKKFEKVYGVANANNVRQFIAFDREYHSSMLSMLAMARQNVRSVRETVSSEAYEAINDLYQCVKTASRNPDSIADDFLNRVRELAIQWTGVIETTLPRDLPWHFVNIGRLIERADKTSRILDVKYFQLLPQSQGVASAIDDLQWATLLRACSGIEAYRRKHQFIRVNQVVEFFLFDTAHPRSVLACVRGLRDSLNAVVQLSNRQTESEACHAADALIEHLENHSAERVIAGGMHEFVDDLQTRLNAVGNALGNDYLYHGTAA
ncbi:MAG: alpha-E domain-containing protein [Planctomycetota bacterium]